jgi:hypothetical protein
MIKITIDEDIHEADIDLVSDYANALIDRDKQLMAEVLYITKQRMEGSCRCYEVICICERL